jgi:hypothetical protein
MTRRDMCLLVGRRAGKIQQMEVAACAWAALARRLELMGDLDVPKFRQLLCAIRDSNIYAVKISRESGFIPAGAPGNRIDLVGKQE